MKKERPRCNFCGVPETKWEGRKCLACGVGRYCVMRDEDIIEQRVYDWALRQRIIGSSGAELNGRDLKRHVKSMQEKGRKVPKYIIDFCNSWPPYREPYDWAKIPKEFRTPRWDES